MGRIKTVYIKRKSKELYEKNKDMFSIDFTKNKKSLGELADIESKQLRNKIAGCIVHLVKTSNKD
jgi:small subunit ribosomal protein S17e